MAGLTTSGPITRSSVVGEALPTEACGGSNRLLSHRLDMLLTDRLFALRSADGSYGEREASGAAGDGCIRASEESSLLGLGMPLRCAAWAAGAPTG